MELTSTFRRPDVVCWTKKRMMVCWNGWNVAAAFGACSNYSGVVVEVVVVVAVVVVVVEVVVVIFASRCFIKITCQIYNYIKLSKIKITC